MRTEHPRASLTKRTCCWLKEPERLLLKGTTVWGLGMGCCEGSACYIARKDGGGGAARGGGICPFAGRDYQRCLYPIPFITVTATSRILSQTTQVDMERKPKQWLCLKGTLFSFVCVGGSCLGRKVSQISNSKQLNVPEHKSAHFIACVPPCCCSYPPQTAAERPLPSLGLAKEPVRTCRKTPPCAHSRLKQSSTSTLLNHVTSGLSFSSLILLLPRSH